ncbi:MULTISPECIES: GNAT family N-acetyltransferase [Streptomyces]|uniref:GNAT family N-acetyltransferase n=1 Tax=Streptomyces venezuelae TaxID=54571 RepID=A0A5P2BB70_STRVZ|nr:MULTISPECIES: GNAT family N-acetyltransferase [Streptomyces]NEA02112.1 GNAT family N-acetyltransferase [Streptomyces sp. SID10116]MYY83729.1 GNAT family N-acetyltransferase [Streptomyces sp. SID335]MYZ18846.1 GNAT family N-acetyltransferase [Streptomyces sp. SID337]NDZ91536.1 GNAT family N-acetyltransferase [Streptomyces sp. SID10115]NEB49434.1 GNAT family N-acetyltransferase [Streptomyces sp. SID339]
MDVSLREVHDSDLPVFFRQMNDPEATRMAAFTPEDPSDHDAFEAHWAKMRTSADIAVRTVLADGDVVGNAGVYGAPGEREVTYWIDRAYWGRGLATAALRGLLELERDRPLYARAAADNAASIRVLEKCGFRFSAKDRGYAPARGEEIDEVVLVLHAG